MFCTKCGKQLNDMAKFCVHCGNKTAAAPPQAPQPEQFAPVQQPLQPEQFAPVQQAPQPEQFAPAQQPLQPEQPAQQYAQHNPSPYQQSVPQQPQYAPAAPKPKKKKTGLIIGLCAGGAVLVASVVLLFLFVLGGHADISGKWYSADGIAGTFEFSGSSANLSFMGINSRGSYSYNPQTKNGSVKLAGFGDIEMKMMLKGDTLYIDSVPYIRKAVPQQTLGLDDFDLNDFDVDELREWLE